MKVVLVNSPLFTDNSQGDAEDCLPPIGLGLIATYLVKHKIHVEIIDSVSNNLSVEELLSVLHDKRPGFLGFNVFTTNFAIVKNIIESLDFETHILIGGPATKELYPELFKIKSSNRIEVIIGDGEIITRDIINNEVSEKPYLTRNNFNVYKILPSSRYFVSDISGMSLDRTFFKNDPSINRNNDLEAKIITSRGCINSCTFCAASHLMNIEIPIRERTISSITEEIVNLLAHYPELASIRILDDLFLKSKDAVAKAIAIFSQFDLSWRSMAHVNTFSLSSKEDLIALRMCGCKELFIGIESGSNRILSEIKKGITRERTLRNLKKLFEAHIDVKGYFIYGFPGETQSDMQETYNLAFELRELAEKYAATFRTSVFQFRPYHGSEIYLQLNQTKSLMEIHTMHDSTLTERIGRGQFNFYSANPSEVCLETIHNYICKTIDLNGSGVYSKQNQGFRPSYKRKGMQIMRALS